jgi:hypothetical protein
VYKEVAPVTGTLYVVVVWCSVIMAGVMLATGAVQAIVAVSNQRRLRQSRKLAMIPAEGLPAWMRRDLTRYFKPLRNVASCALMDPSVRLSLVDKRAETRSVRTNATQMVRIAYQSVGDDFNNGARFTEHTFYRLLQKAVLQQVMNQITAEHSTSQQS